MTALLTAPACGALVLAALVIVLVRSAAREAAHAPAGGSPRLLAALLALFVAQVAARFLHG